MPIQRQRLQPLRKIGAALAEATICERCGGSQLETPNTATHCICPGGPAWDTLLQSEIGHKMRLVEGRELWPDLPPDKIAFYNEATRQWYVTALGDLRRALLALPKAI